jgi:DNA-binding NtrC family response regulator
MPDSSPLLALVGRMKVEQLARLVGLDVEELVAVVVGTPQVGARARARPASVRTPTVAPPIASVTPTGEPPLAAMFGRASYRDLHRAVDRWVLARVLDEEGGNVSHAASRLHVSRRTLRERWARARDFQPKAPLASGDSQPTGPDGLEPPSLTEVLVKGGKYADIRNAVDLWLIGGTLAREQGNVTRTAQSLGIARKQVRERWARVRPQ